MCGENLDLYRVPNYHLVHALNACFFICALTTCKNSLILTS